ncbi:MAG: hypothetical protein DRN01_05180 [Thermoplasmata archaeon]|nr:MAG: hypothetical protein DRN01_05180 [Thermoplasmata archaeon]
MKLRRTDIAVIISLFAFILILFVGYLLNPSLIYDQFIWRYYWGPVVADAANHAASYHGVVANEGYTLVSEITYGIIVVVALYYIYRLLKKLEISIDWGFCLALLPFILFGPFSRALEDTGYFKIPLTYWFISPLIYVQIAVYTIFFLVIGWFFEKKNKHNIKEKLGLLITIYFAVTLVFLFLWSCSSLVAYKLHPILIILCGFTGIAMLLFDYHRREKITANMVLFSSGLLLLLPSVALTSLWMVGERWNVSTGVRVDVLCIVSFLASLTVFLTWFVAKFSKKKNVVEPYTKPLNLAMLFGHMTDGLTSYFSIYDPLGMGIPVYGEKHPIPLFLMDLSGGLLFPVLKFVLIILIIYLLDVIYKEDLKDHEMFVNLLKIGVFILGIAPGSRDILRVSMGV